MKTCILFMVVLCIHACKSNNKTADEEVSEIEEIAYPDGEYCADVAYYNLGTGKRATYTLNVEVEDNEVTTIYWPSGGWLDGDYFSSEALDDNGYCSFRTRKGLRYAVEIKGDACGYTDIEEMNEDVEEDFYNYKIMSLTDCAEMTSMTQKEFERYLKVFEEKPSDKVSMQDCDRIKEYMEGIREIKRKHAAEMAKLNAKSRALEKQMNEGYIQGVYKFSSRDGMLCQCLIVKKYKRFYWLVIVDDRECPMGLMQFDEKNSNWQNVLVKETPDTDEIKVFQMKIGGIGYDKQWCNDQIKQYCHGI